jgi:hypothetical protein
MALTKEHEIYTWGYGEYGQLGDGNSSISESEPIKIEVEGTPVFIASGLNHNIYLTDNRDIYAWGRNNMNQLGTGKSTSENRPSKVLDDIAVAKSYEILTNPFAGASPWAGAELSKLYALNLLPPMLWARYKENVTRAEFAGLLMNIYEEMKQVSTSNTDKTKSEDIEKRKAEFEDIENHLYETEIKKAYEIGLIDGITNKIFNPTGRITRQEAVKMICTFISIIEGLELPIVDAIPFYIDANTIAGWASSFVAFAYHNEIMMGSDRRFDPLSNLTREQTLAIVYRIIEKLKSGYEWIL